MLERNWLKQRRREQGLTQEKLAELVGISNKHVCQIEKGYRNPSGKVAMKISKVLGFDMAYFFTNEVHLEGKSESKVS